MAVTFNRDIDQHSLGIVRDGKQIGFLQWHPYREPRIVLIPALEHITIVETEECLKRLVAIKDTGKQGVN